MKQKKSFNPLWICGILIHLVVLALVLDLYFKSPITSGMKTFKFDRPFARRAVLFVADGLRAETLYVNNTRTPYLSSICNGTGSYGVIHTRVPTESRPGHVALLAGLYEDPSAIFTGWKKNLVAFDSLINESNFVWAMGSPDIVQIFPKSDISKLNVASYDPEEEDFSGKSSTINLDNWVFKKIKDLMSHDKPCLSEIRLLKNSLMTIKSQKDKLTQLRQKCVFDGKGCQTYLREVLEDSCKSKINNELIPLTAAEITTYRRIKDLESTCNASCSDLCEEGNFFFLHLLGMDSAGHVHKPGSKEYFENLVAVDNGIKQTVETIDKFFGDKETVYIFTADHGMTNWGSHGDGSDHERLVPFVIWGKGVRSGTEPHDMEQADLTPLIATLIGVPIPMNSVGVLSEHILDGRAVDVAQALLINVLQISEQYVMLRKTFDKPSSMFQEYPAFLDESVDRQILYIKILLDNGKIDVVLKKCHTLIEELKNGIHYMSNYYFYPKLLCIMFGFIVWMVSLLISTMDDPKHNIAIYNRIVDISSEIFKVVATVLLIILSIMINNNSGFISYIYALFPAVVIIAACSNENLMRKCFALKNTKKLPVCLVFIVSSILIQFLVGSFFNKAYCSIIFGSLGLWVVFIDISGHVKIMWILCCTVLSALLFNQSNTNFTYFGFILGVIVWLTFYLNVIRKQLRKFVSASKYKRRCLWKIMINIPLVLFLMTSINSIIVANSFQNDNGVFYVNKIYSWVLTVFAIVSIGNSPTTVYGRFGQIGSCLIIPLTLMSMNIEIIMYTVIVGTLYLWIRIENGIFNNDHITLNYIDYNDLDELESSTRVADFRKTFIYLALIIGYYFSFGNIASVNGFDPMWTRAYVSTFNPIIMCSLIILKMVIPFLIITTAFHTVNVLTKTNTHTTFKILLLYCDQMVIYFIMYIRNEGSWKDIGQSLSHFVIMEAMILVMILFYAIAHYITRCKMPFNKAMTELKRDKLLNLDELRADHDKESIQSKESNSIKSQQSDTIAQSSRAAIDDDNIFKVPAIPKKRRKHYKPTSFIYPDILVTDPETQVTVKRSTRSTTKALSKSGSSNSTSEPGPSKVDEPQPGPSEAFEPQPGPSGMCRSGTKKNKQKPCPKSKKKFNLMKKSLVMRPVLTKLSDKEIETLLRGDQRPTSDAPKRRDEGEEN